MAIEASVRFSEDDPTLPRPARRPLDGRKGTIRRRGPCVSYGRRGNRTSTCVGPPRGVSDPAASRSPEGKHTRTVGPRLCTVWRVTGDALSQQRRWGVWRDPARRGTDRQADAVGGAGFGSPASEAEKSELPEAKVAESAGFGGSREPHVAGAARPSGHWSCPVRRGRIRSCWCRGVNDRAGR